MAEAKKEQRATEQERIFDVEPSPPDARDHVVEAIYPPVGDFPETLDLSPWLLEVKDQGRSSTCAAQTAATIKEYQEMRDTGTAAHYSVEFVYFHRSNKPAEGMYGRDVMSILHHKGIPARFPSHPMDHPTTLEEAKEYTIAEYARVDTIDGLKAALARDGPCYISVPVYNNGNRMWFRRENDTQTGGHAMTVIGYNADGFVIRNSWGRRWGDNGHTVFPYADWGMQWEVWTAVDREGSRAPFRRPDPKRKTCCAIL